MGLSSSDSPITLSYNHCVNEVNACTLIYQLCKLIAPIEEVVTHNTRTDTNVQYPMLKVNVIGKHSDMLTHNLAPKLG